MEESRVKFLSLAYPEKYGYIFDSKEYRNPGFPAVESKFRMFNTEGDGLTQHSGDWAVTYDYLGDYLASLATLMLKNTDFKDEENALLYRRVGQTVLNGAGDRNIAFAKSVVWKERKEKYADEDYYSLEEQKIDRGKNRMDKRHDRRYHEINTSMDGTAKSVFSILRNEWSDGMELLGLAKSIYDYYQKQEDSWSPHPADILGWWKDLDYSQGQRNKQVLSFGYEAIRYTVRIYEQQLSAENELGNYTRNYLPKKEVKELVADTDAV